MRPKLEAQYFHLKCGTTLYFTFPSFYIYLGDYLTLNNYHVGRKCFCA